MLRIILITTLLLALVVCSRSHETVHDDRAGAERVPDFPTTPTITQPPTDTPTPTVTVTITATPTGTASPTPTTSQTRKRSQRRSSRESQRKSEKQECEMECSDGCTQWEIVKKDIWRQPSSKEKCFRQRVNLYQRNVHKTRTCSTMCHDDCITETINVECSATMTP